MLLKTIDSFSSPLSLSLSLSLSACLTLFLLSVSSGRTAAGRSRLLVTDWSEEDVGAWLVEEGLEGLAVTFRANNIDGAELLRMTKETLVELRVGETRKQNF